MFRELPSIQITAGQMKSLANILSGVQSAGEEFQKGVSSLVESVSSSEATCTSDGNDFNEAYAALLKACGLLERRTAQDIIVCQSVLMEGIAHSLEVINQQLGSLFSLLPEMDRIQKTAHQERLSLQERPILEENALSTLESLRKPIPSRGRIEAWIKSATPDLAVIQIGARNLETENTFVRFSLNKESKQVTPKEFQAEIKKFGEEELGKWLDTKVYESALELDLNLQDYFLARSLSNNYRVDPMEVEAFIKKHNISIDRAIQDTTSIDERKSLIRIELEDIALRRSCQRIYREQSEEGVRISIRNLLSYQKIKGLERHKDRQEALSDLGELFQGVYVSNFRLIYQGDNYQIKDRRLEDIRDDFKLEEIFARFRTTKPPVPEINS